MKRTIVLFLIIIKSIGCSAQYLKAIYNFEERFDDARPTAERFPESLHYTYHTIYWGNQVYAFANSHELKQFPDGKMRRQYGDVLQAMDICTKPIQFFQWVDYDSMVVKRIQDNAFTPQLDSCAGQHTMWKFSEGVERWEFKEEYRTINGFVCQRAQSFVGDVIYWDVWFAPEIPVKGSPMGRLNLPGVMVIGEVPRNYWKFELQSLEMLDPKGAKPYLPPCVNDYFPYKGTMKPVQPKTLQKQ